MNITDILPSLFAPPILFFLLGMLTVLVKSDLEIPPEIVKGASIFLLLSIGLEGGLEAVDAVRVDPNFLSVILVLMIFSIFISSMTSIFGARFLEKVVGLKTADAWGTAGLYGAVSSATLLAAIGIVEPFQAAAPEDLIYGGWMPAVNVFLDAPGVIAAVFLGRMALEQSKGKSRITLDKKELFRDSVFGYAIWLMICGLIVGGLAQMFSPNRLESAMAFFDEMFIGILCIFLLEMGMTAARRLGELKELGRRLILAVVAAFGMPQVWAGLAIAAAYVAHLMFPGMLGWGDAFVFAAMAGSASYISAPPAIRAAFPEANPTIYLGMSLALTFPFNMIVSLPLWMIICRALWGA